VTSFIAELGKSMGKTRSAVRKFYYESIGARRDKSYLSGDVPSSNIVSHAKYLSYLSEIGNHKGMKILEVGSREVTGPSAARTMFADAQYVGFDFYAGPNVDVVGDAHKLSRYFDEQFDIIFSCAVFEHLAMPWVVATEIAKLLKVGGIVFVETHFSFSSHERPWHFYQFSDMGLRALFSPALGFECLESGMCNPIVGRYSSFADDYLKYMPVTGLYCHSEYLGRKLRDVTGFDWNDVALEEIVEDAKYPAPSNNEEPE
jgi:SAM-dependent methyltransferase